MRIIIIFIFIVFKIKLKIIISVIYNFIVIGPAPIKAKAKKYRLQFDINSIPENHQIKAAEVRFPMKYDQALGNEEFIHVILHDIVQPGEKGLSKPILRLGW